MTSVSPETELPPSYFASYNSVNNRKYTLPTPEGDPNNDVVYPTYYAPIYNPAFYSISDPPPQPQQSQKISNPNQNKPDSSIKCCIPCLNTKFKLGICILLTALVLIILIAGLAILLIFAICIISIVIIR
jgi:hypothetical protein